jgi:hypothetical protein
MQSFLRWDETPTSRGTASERMSIMETMEGRDSWTSLVGCVGCPREFAFGDMGLR